MPDICPFCALYSGARVPVRCKRCDHVFPKPPKVSPLLVPAQWRLLVDPRTNPALNPKDNVILPKRSEVRKKRRSLINQAARSDN